MLAVLERYIRARVAADIGHTQTQNVKLALSTTADRKIIQKCNDIIQAQQELKDLIDKRLAKIRPEIEEYLTMDFDVLDRLSDLTSEL